MDGLIVKSDVFQVTFGWIGSKKKQKMAVSNYNIPT